MNNDKYIHKIINNWIVKEIDTTKTRKYYILECLCGCGEQVSVRVDNLNDYNKKCKALKRKLRLEKHIDREDYKTRLINKQFGNLLVKNFYGYNKRKQILYSCECQCENKTILNVTYTDLVKNKKDNCGCLTKEKQSLTKRKYNTYDLSGKYGIGYTSKGEEFYFDLEDYNLIKDYCWNVHDGYIDTRYGKTIIKMHRLIMKVNDPKDKVDHIFHNKNDNRKSELRVTTNSQNCMNHIIHSNNTSGVTGVNWDSEKSLWRSRLWIDGKCHHLGYYTDLDEAIKVRNRAEDTYFKEYKYVERG